MKLKRIILTTIIVLIFTLTNIIPMPMSTLVRTSVVSAAVNTYYVATTGSDNNDGSSGSPWGTILFASRHVVAGDTVIISGGTYSQDAIWPTASGIEQASITFKAADGETPIITGSGLLGQVIHLSVANKYIIIEGINLLNTSNCSPVTISDAKYITLKNCSFKNNITDTGSFMTIDLVSYITIENCTLDTTGGQLTNGGDGEGDGIYVNAGDHVLIQNNHFIKCGHYATDLKDFGGPTTSYNNVFRNNLIEQYWGGGINIICGANHNVVENNYFYYSGAECTYPKTGIGITGDENIVRNNIVGWSSDGSRGGRNASSIDLSSYSPNGDCNNNRVYNNISYKSGGVPMYVSERESTTVTGNKIMNNIFYYNRVGGTLSDYWYVIFETGRSSTSNQWTSNFPNNNLFCNNIWKHTDTTNTNYSDIQLFQFDGGNKQAASFSKTLNQMQTDYPLYFYGNKEETPEFVNADNGDFRVKPGSPAIDAGANLAVTTVAGAGINTVTVDDSLSFTDGYGIMTGDRIKIDGNQPVTITNVDYTNNVLTLSSPVAYAIGARVNIEFKGTAPDIGAVEYDMSSTPMPIRATLMPLPTPTPVPTGTQSHSSTPKPTAVGPTLSPNEKLYDFGGYNKGEGVNKYLYTDGTPMTLNGVETQAWKFYAAKDICTDRGASDAYVTYKFQGTRIKIYAESGPYCGIAAISIFEENNNVIMLEQDCDFYNDYYIGKDALVYTSPDLSDGIYTIKVRVTGTFNPANIQNDWTINLAKVGIISVLNATPTPKPTATPTLAPTATPTLTPSATPVVTPVPTFSDLQGFEWAQEFINKLAASGVINGYDGGIFKPENNITRAEFAKMLTVFYQKVNEGAISTFTDVSKSEWYYKYVASAQAENLAQGNGDGTFSPDSYITREEMFIFNGRALNKYKDVNILGKDDAETGTILADFVDQESVSEWARGFVSTNIKLKLVTGSQVEGGMALFPLNPITRAEVAVVLARGIE